MLLFDFFCISFCKYTQPKQYLLIKYGTIAIRGQNEIEKFYSNVDYSLTCRNYYSLNVFWLKIFY